jgi:hypothetical protein
MNKRSQLALLLAIVLLSAPPAWASAVPVTISGNQALATISLNNGTTTYDADVTITFDTPVNLTADELNLTADIVNPNDPTLLSRLGCTLPLLCQVTVDPAFPVMITVEPLNVPWLFHTGFESGETVYGNLSFQNAYDFEVHTADLTYVDGTHYRLFKAPLNQAFDDISSSITSGSVRANGRGGTFSQFLIVSDTRLSLTVELDKELALQDRIISAALADVLRTDLLGLLAEVQVDVLVTVDYAAAIANLDQLIAQIQGNAGTNIANVWSSDHTLVNDAGEMLSLAQTLRYTLVRLQNGQ